MSDRENSVRAQNESTSDVDYYRVKAQSILRQMSSMKCYLNADAVNQFDEADLLATFTTVIGNDDELSDIEKLQYLRSSLGGVALETIRSLEPSNANYKRL